MDVITIESQAYKDLIAKINSIAKFVISHQESEKEQNIDGWVDSYEVCSFLKISSRTLQRLRTDRIINYSKIRGKNYYKLSEVSRLLNEHIINSSEDCLQNLIKNHQLHVEQRRDTKTDK
ncbi:MAG: helix-turn-helix domain-containing protein [Prevotellaceae bacterium]|jgi:hypothetical protein|nr:helix-turn-helix domain-containing protein [Prevotellaceae bacterium]